LLAFSLYFDENGYENDPYGINEEIRISIGDYYPVNCTQFELPNWEMLLVRKLLEIYLLEGTGKESR
jgi:hypothetical protein